MMEFVGLFIVLVLSQIVTMGVLTMMGFKIFGSEWFIKKYMNWFGKTMKSIEKEMGQFFEENEL